jgi:hypothetical protein
MLPLYFSRITEFIAMSKHLREDKTCLNCGAIVEERYCTHCGQENLELRESFGHLFRHFFEDFTHYDSKLFITIKDLILKPGFLTKEYLAGRRSQYLHPIRMYVFISFLYFLALLSFNHFEDHIEESIANNASLKTKERIAANLDSMLLTKSNDTLTDKIKNTTIHQVLTTNGLDTLPQYYDFTVVGNITHKGLKSYDSLQNSLPEDKRDRSLKSWFYHRCMESVDRYGGEGTVLRTAARTQHIIPKMMFVLLPLFAWLLKLFYDRKKYLYVDHAIFSLHFHSAFFLFLLIVDIITRIFSLHDLNNLELVAFIYIVIALRNTYHESLLKSFFKALGVVALYSIFIAIGFVIVALANLVF